MRGWRNQLRVGQHTGRFCMAGHRAFNWKFCDRAKAGSKQRPPIQGAFQKSAFCRPIALRCWRTRPRCFVRVRSASARMSGAFPATGNQRRRARSGRRVLLRSPTTHASVQHDHRLCKRGSNFNAMHPANPGAGRWHYSLVLTAPLHARRSKGFASTEIQMKRDLFFVV